MKGADLKPDDRAARTDTHGYAALANRRGKAERRATAKQGAVSVYLPRARDGHGKRQRDDWGQELCFSFNDKMGRCAGGAAG
eukprot:11175727-Heterocapsa_arctica.AAC.1